MENIAEQLHQINAVIEMLKDARPLCEDAATAGLVASALDGAETLQQMLREAGWPGLPEIYASGVPGLLPQGGEACPATDPAELCFPV